MQVKFAGGAGSFIEKTKGYVKTIIRIWYKWVCLLECWPNQVRMGVLVCRGQRRGHAIQLAKKTGKNE